MTALQDIVGCPWIAGDDLTTQPKDAACAIYIIRPDPEEFQVEGRTENYIKLSAEAVAGIEHAVATWIQYRRNSTGNQFLYR